MKAKNLLLLLLLIPAFVTAQDNQEMQTLFGKTNHLGWWVSPEFAYTKVDGRDAWLGGISGGIISNHSFSIGLAGYGVMNSNNLAYENILDTQTVYLYSGYGGLKLEYRLYPLKQINIAFPLLIGGGGVGYSTWNWHSDYHHNHYESNGDYYYIWDGFFVLEPGVTVGINILKFMRLNAGVSYRYVPSVNLPKLDKNAMSNFNATVALQFGNL
jgi:hypothetical protein